MLEFAEPRLDYLEQKLFSNCVSSKLCVSVCLVCNVYFAGKSQIECFLTNFCWYFLVSFIPENGYTSENLGV